MLSVENLSVTYDTNAGRLAALRDVSLKVAPGETLGLVGESGSGKSTFGKAILGLVPGITGKVLFEGTDLAALSPRKMRPFRSKIQMIFQDPEASLNPRQTIFRILSGPFKVQGDVPRGEQRRRIFAMLDRVGLPASMADKYPHEMSGGQKQRVGIARALMLEPTLVICDEPVSALDVSIQVQVINLLNELRQSLNLSYIFISHDLAVVKYISDRIAVLNRGQLMEMGRHDEIWNHAAHPYTRSLFAALPGRRGRGEDEGDELLPAAPAGAAGGRLAYRHLTPTHLVACEQEQAADAG